MQSLQDYIKKMEEENKKIEVDDYVRWLGKQKPVGLAWIGLSILEAAAAIFIVAQAYINVDSYLAQSRPEVDTAQIANKVIQQIMEK